jgi:hypothetical protein
VSMWLGRGVAHREHRASADTTHATLNSEEHPFLWPTAQRHSSRGPHASR